MAPKLLRSCSTLMTRPPAGKLSPKSRNSVEVGTTRSSRHSSHGLVRRFGLRAEERAGEAAGHTRDKQRRQKFDMIYILSEVLETDSTANRNGGSGRAQRGVCRHSAKFARTARSSPAAGVQPPSMARTPSNDRPAAAGRISQLVVRLLE